MAAPFSDEGIVLRRRAFGDADRILVVLTKDHGKLSVMAKGLRRARARNAAGMDLLARSQLQLIPGRSLAVLAQARPIGPIAGAADPVRLACASVLAELVDATVEEGHPEPRVYEILAEASARIGSPAADPRLALALAAFALAAAGGYQPELTICAACGRELENRDGRFVAALGGVVQGKCETGAGGLPCAAVTLRVLRRMAVADESTVLRLRWSPQLRDELQAILIAHLEHHLDRPIKAARVLVEVSV
ncbi:MAG: DNA repair protein RecO [Candidatus Dormibacteria bacterium]